MDTIILAILVIAFVILGLFIGVVIARRVLEQIREKILVDKSINLTFFEVKLPKENEIEIKAAEQMFMGLLGISKKLSKLQAFKSSKIFVSFEVVAFQETIRFYVVCPRSIASVVDRQINGTYPSAEIAEVKEFNLFPEKSKVSYAALKLDKSSRVPISTYEELPVDTISTLADVFSKLHHNEAALVQLVISPAGSEWRNAAKKYLNTIREPETDEDGKPKKKSKKENEDTISMIDKKASKSGFHSDIRVVVVSETKPQADAHLTNILSTFDQYTKEGGNRFVRVPSKALNRIVTDVIYRIPRESMILNVEELATLYHFPNKRVEAPYIQWLLSRKAPAPDYSITDFEPGRMYLGKNTFRGKSKEIFISPEDRMRHKYVIGQTGAGKSGFISGMMIRDIKMGNGCAFIDPHGSDIEKIMQQIPPERVEDVILFDPSDIERPMGLNMLEFQSDAQKTLAVNEMLNIFNTLYDLKKTGGPMFEQYFRYGIMLLVSDVESGATLLEVPKIFADEGYREYKLSKATNQEVIDFWKKQAEKARGEASLSNVTPYVVSKLASFLTNDYVRPIVAQQHSAFNFRKVMDEGKILLVKLSKGKIGEFNMSLLGMIIVSKLLISALEREDVPEAQRTPFYLYIDEFQNFLTDGINQILSEARKYQLSLTLAHQYIGQLTVNQDTKIREAVFGNVGNKFVLRVGPDDAEYLAKQFEGLFNETDLQQTENLNMFTKMLVNGKPATPFTMTSRYGDSPYDMITRPNPQIADIIRQISRLKYGRDKNIVENEIAMRGKNIKLPEKPKNDFGNFGLPGV